jgi:hypothetical protein
MKGNFTKIIMLIVIVIFAINCKSSDTEDGDVPACIENKIEEILTNEVTNPPTQVWRWEVDGKTYYYITSDCCDQFNILYSENWDIVCAPDGGFTGQGDGNCPDFKGEIVKTLIWEDDRK